MRACWVVSGRVQGVGFRAWTVERASALGLGGRVANRADGCVLVEAEGPDDSILELESALGEGPRHARVDAVNRSEVTSDEIPQAFSIVKPWR